MYPKDTGVVYPGNFFLSWGAFGVQGGRNRKAWRVDGMLCGRTAEGVPAEGAGKPLDGGLGEGGAFFESCKLVFYCKLVSSFLIFFEE